MNPDDGYERAINDVILHTIRLETDLRIKGEECRHYAEKAESMGLMLAKRDEEIERLRERLTEWVERLRWADGLTDVVEQMEREAAR